MKHLTDSRRLKTLRLLNHGQHTGNLENLHSIILAYAPKRLNFDPTGYDIRVKLAVIDHNSNVMRDTVKGIVIIIIAIEYHAIITVPLKPHSNSCRQRWSGENGGIL